MEGNCRGTNDRILGAEPPIFAHISLGIPLHVQRREGTAVGAQSVKGLVSECGSLLHSIFGFWDVFKLAYGTALPLLFFLWI